MARDLDDQDLYDVKDKATYVLGQVLAGSVDDIDNLGDKNGQVAVESALEEDKLLTTNDTNRNKSRVLIVTSDIRVLEEGSLEHDFYSKLAPQFDEVHIMVTTSLHHSKKLTKRVGDNLWIYTTGHVSWLGVPLSVGRVAKKQLMFGGGFRPDFVVATDPYESALGAYMLANKHDRPFLLQVSELFWTETFKKKKKSNHWRQRIASWLLNRVNSVRVSTNEIFDYLKEHYKDIPDLSVLPRHYNIKAIIDATSRETEDLFPQFNSVFLYVGKLDHNSTLFRVIDAMREALQSPRAVLVVVGDGPSKEEFKKRAEIFGIDKQVIFKPDTVDTLSIMKSADLFICPDITEASDDIVIKAAAAGIPLLLAKTDLRKDLFTDGEDALLCDPEDTQAFANSVMKIVGNKPLMTKLKSGAQYTIRNRLHEDPEVFYQSYRDSLERVFNLTTVEDTNKSEAESETDNTKIAKTEGV